MIFNMKYLYDNLGVKLNRKEQKDNITNSLESMIRHQVFSTSHNLDIRQVNINDIIKLDYQLIDNGFTIVNDNVFDKIFQYDKQKVDKYSLFNTYLAIKKYADNDTQESYPSIEFLMHICNIRSNNTIHRYVNILTELGVIYCIKGDYYIDQYNDIRKSNNIYKVLI